MTVDILKSGNMLNKFYKANKQSQHHDQRSAASRKVQSIFPIGKLMLGFILRKVQKAYKDMSFLVFSILQGERKKGEDK